MACWRRCHTSDSSHNYRTKSMASFTVHACSLASILACLSMGCILRQVRGRQVSHTCTILFLSIPLMGLETGEAVIPATLDTHSHSPLTWGSAATMQVLSLQFPLNSTGPSNLQRQVSLSSRTVPDCATGCTYCLLQQRWDSWCRHWLPESWTRKCPPLRRIGAVQAVTPWLLSRVPRLLAPRYANPSCISSPPLKDDAISIPTHTADASLLTLNAMSHIPREGALSTLG